MVGSDFDDVIVGLEGKDRIDAGKGKDLVCGGKAKDKLKGGPGKDRLFGEAGKDKLIGGRREGQVRRRQGRRLRQELREGEDLSDPRRCRGELGVGSGWFRSAGPREARAATAARWRSLLLRATRDTKTPSGR